MAGRPKVPHCKGCNWLWTNQDSVDKGHRRQWKCRHFKYWRVVDGQEIRTSPKSCPYRMR